MLILIVGCTKEIEIPHKGEPCEEVNFDDFSYNPTNFTDRTRAERDWNEYTINNQIKGYCKDGKRIGGLI